MDSGLGVVKARSIVWRFHLIYGRVAAHSPGRQQFGKRPTGQVLYRELSDRETEGISMCLAVCEHSAGAEAE